MFFTLVADNTGYCVAASSGSPAGLWKNIACNSTQKYLCERVRDGYTPRPTVPAPGPPTQPNDDGCYYDWVGYGGNCFKVRGSMALSEIQDLNIHLSLLRQYAVKVRRHTPWSRVHCHGCRFTHSQFHSRRHSLRITLKYTILVRMRISPREPARHDNGASDVWALTAHCFHLLKLTRNTSHPTTMENYTNKKKLPELTTA